MQLTYKNTLASKKEGGPGMCFTEHTIFSSLLISKESVDQTEWHSDLKFGIQDLHIYL